MRKSPLHQFHLDYGGKMVEFAGWELPMSYTGIHDEHLQVRQSGGVFDVSHMGRVRFKGRHARRLLERLCSRSISDMQMGQCRYSLICNERGGVRDDVLIYRFDEDDFIVVVNAANREKLVGHFEEVRAAEEFKVKIDDQTESTAMIAVQGPKVMDMVAQFSKEIPALKRYRFTVKNLLVMKIVVSRTGYTGENGVEAFLPASAVNMAMKLILKDIDMTEAEALIKPAGLGARDTLRMEAGMPLYGNELGEDICALSCGVDFAIKMDKHEMDRGSRFIGQDALEKVIADGGPKEKIIGITVEGKRTAREGNTVYVGETKIGKVTSGCMSPTLGHPIAMALVEAAHTEVGSSITIDTGRTRLEGTIIKLPFYKAPKPEPKAQVTA